MKDLRQLEEIGVKVNKPRDQYIKAGLVSVVGDNLGLHQLGEYNASFSNGHICRTCKADYNSVCVEHKVYSGITEGFEPGELTVQEYDALAERAVENGRGGGPETCGIKGHCVLNDLQAFHCAQGMPPCLGTDCLIYF